MDDRDLFCGMTGDEWNDLHDRLARLLCHQHDFDWNLIATDSEDYSRPPGEPSREDFVEMAAQVVRLVLRRDPLPPEHYARAWSRQLFDESRSADPPDPSTDPAYARRYRG